VQYGAIELVQTTVIGITNIYTQAATDPAVTVKTKYTILINSRHTVTVSLLEPRFAQQEYINIETSDTDFNLIKCVVLGYTCRIQ